MSLRGSGGDEQVLVRAVGAREGGKNGGGVTLGLLGGQRDAALGGQRDAALGSGGDAACITRGAAGRGSRGCLRLEQSMAGPLR